MSTKQFFSGDMLYDLYNIAITPQQNNSQFYMALSDKSFLDEFCTLNIRLPRQTGHTTASINFINRIITTGNYDIYYLCYKLNMSILLKQIGYTISGEKIRDSIDLDVNIITHQQFLGYNFPRDFDDFEKNIIIVTDLYFILGQKKKTIKLYEQQLLSILKQCREKQLTFMVINLQ